MITTNNYQEKFNEILLNTAPTNLSLAQEVSDILDISIDSAYRRLRNQTEYSIGEAMSIALHFDIPLEALNEVLGNVATFKVNHLDNSMDSYSSYLQNMLNSLLDVQSSSEAHIYFAAEDIPVFYHFSKPALSKFKITYWLKSLLNVKEYQFKNFENISIPEDILNKASEIFDCFNKINSTEIWTTETTLSTLKQIKYYWDAGFFENANSAINVLSELEHAIEEIQRNSETGYKFHKGSMSGTKHAFYLSDVMIGNNSILAKTKDGANSFISYSTFNFMRTSNTHFNKQNELWLDNLISKSTLLSTVAEKQRNQFFKSTIKQIRELVTYIESSNL